MKKTEQPAPPAGTEESVTLNVKSRSDLRKFSKAEAKVNETVAKLKTLTVEKTEDVEIMVGTLKDAKDVAGMIEAKRVELVTPLNNDLKKINDYAKRTLLAKLELEIEAGKKKVVDWQKSEEKRLKDARTAARILQLEALGFVLIERGAYEVPGVSLFGAGMISDTADDTWKEMVEFATAALNRRTAQTLDEHKADLELAQTFGSEEDKEQLQQKINDLEEEQFARRNAGALPGFSSLPGNIGVKGLTKRWTFELQDLSKVPAEYLKLDEVKVRQKIAEGAREIPGLRIFQDTSLSLR